MKKNFKKVLITTAIDYVNDVLHLGHAYQKIAADVLARYYRLKLGQNNVYFVTGTDEHGLKVQEAASKEGKEVKKFVDEISFLDQKEQEALNISYDRFIRTTDEDHKENVIDFWKRVEKNGDIYLGDFQGLYCQGCESYKTEIDLENNKCPLHPKEDLKLITEKNYFFRWQKYIPFLKELILKNEDFILPEARRNEVLAFVDKIEDITISRRKEAVSWGIEVPGDPDQVIYVWFDALINYLTAGKKVGFWDEETKIIHLLGQDNLRWHALLWPAMLKSAGYSFPSTIYAHGFITLNGQKISKSLGNIIRPRELTSKYGADPVRYYLLGKTSFAEGGDFSLAKLEEVYNGDLANGLGNFTARVLTLAENQEFDSDQKLSPEVQLKIEETKKIFEEKILEFKFNEALSHLWNLIAFGDSYINQKKPWFNKEKEVLFDLVVLLDNIAGLLKPFLPETTEKITQAIYWSHQKLRVKKIDHLFPKIK